jgi:hypothetical protein
VLISNAWLESGGGMLIVSAVFIMAAFMVTLCLIYWFKRFKSS